MSHIYKNAATKAPNPRTPPAAILTLAAAPCEFAGVLVPVGLPLLDDPEAPLVMPETDTGVELWRMRVVLSFALTTTVRVWLDMEPVPARVRVWTPGPTAGMSTAAGCEVTTAGWVGIKVATAGCEGMNVTTEGCEVATGNWPVTTPRELVWRRRLVWGAGSTEDCKYMLVTGLVWYDLRWKIDSQTEQTPRRRKQQSRRLN